MAKRHEEEYKWFEAAENYRQVINLIPKTKSIEEKQKMAYCLSRASKQTENPEDYKRILQLAIESYLDVTLFYETAEKKENPTTAMYCKIMSEYISSWLPIDPLEKCNRLKRCLTLGDTNLKNYKRRQDKMGYGKMCNTLLECVFEYLYIIQDYKEMKKLIEKGTDYADEAIKIFSNLQNNEELLRSYSIGSLQSWYAANISEKGSRRNNLIQRSIDFSEKALNITHETRDTYYHSIANWAAAFSKLIFKGEVELSLKYAEDMLRKAITAKDNLLKGIASYILAFVMDWTIRRETIPKKIKEGHQEIAKYAKDAIYYLQPVCNDLFLAETYWVYTESYSSQSQNLELNPKIKRTLSKKAVDLGRKGVKHAKHSGSPDAMGSTLHALSKALHFFSNLQKEKKYKLKTLKEALIYRQEYNKIVEKSFPSNDWLCGVGKNYEGLIKYDISKLEIDPKKKVNLLINAVTNIENGISRCKRTITTPIPTLISAIGRYERSLSGFFEQLFCLTKNENYLKKSIEHYNNSAKEFKKANLSSRAAESYWKMATCKSNLSLYNDASISFINASNEYENASKQIPSVSNIYKDYATYMKAWSEIEKAKSSNKHEKYLDAVKHYEEAANLVDLTEKWKYLSPNFIAWSKLEKAEELSRKEKPFESLEAFYTTAKSFEKSAKNLNEKLDTIIDPDEKIVSNKLVASSKVRIEYSLGRAAVEEARLLDKQGDHDKSSNKYGHAADLFQRALSLSNQKSEKAEIEPIIRLCKAWQLVTKAEAEAKPEFYLKASKLFDEVKELSISERGKLRALGHSSFCRSLEYVAQFEATRDLETYVLAKSHMEVAESYYVRAGIDIASEYAKATSTLLDAYSYIHRAETEIDLIKRPHHYEIAERLLQASAGHFVKAKHQEKNKLIKRLLENIKTKRQSTISLTKMVHSIRLTSSTDSFSSPISMQEEAVGLQRFNRAEIQANLQVNKNELTAGEDLELRLDLVNIGNHPALLVRIDNLIPTNLEVSTIHPSYYYISKGSIELDGRKLNPLKVESIELKLETKRKMEITIHPEITYVSEIGEFRKVRSQPNIIMIHPKLKLEFKTESASKTFNFLANAFIHDYMRKKLTLEKSGWRTFMQIVKKGKVSKARIYGPFRRRGHALSELERRGLIDIRIFVGERGRGGNIQKARILYKKEPVKRYIDKITMEKS
jgi:hypothetical protein